MSTAAVSPELSSFRDPSGFIFREKGIVYRQINRIAKDDYSLFMNSGLYDKLVEQGLLVSHSEVKVSGKTAEAFAIIKPQQIPFISYPYEWSFGQLKDAALTTLQIERVALAHGLSLKDASAYNIQFLNGKPLLIDTLSFEIYKEGAPWVAYRQFCQHFLAPLALMSYNDIRLGTLSRDHLDGIPLDLAVRLLPGRTKFSLNLASHLHLHAASQNRHADDAAKLPQKATYSLNKQRLLAILQSLESAVKTLQPPGQKTVWHDYYDNTNYTAAADSHKKELIQTWLKQLKPNSVWDAGGNDGTYGSLASNLQIPTLSTDIDAIAVEKAYRKQKSAKDTFLLPLIIDLTNPSPSIGWDNTERQAFLDRVHVDTTFCLAFIHHLAIANNLPLTYVAKLFHDHTQKLVIEFVPKEDSNTKRLLANREDIFPEYTEAGFEKVFKQFFRISKKITIKDSVRTLYLMERA